MWRRLFDILFWLGTAAFFGGLIALGPIAAPAVFNTARDAQISMPGIASPPLDVSRQVGGEIFGAILNRFAWVEAASLTFMFFGIAGWILSFRAVRRSSWFIAGLWVFLAACSAYDAASLRPRVWALRQTIRDQATAHAADAGDSAWPERAQFDALHARDELLGNLKACALLVILITAATRRTVRVGGPSADEMRRTIETSSSTSHAHNVLQ